MRKIIVISFITLDGVIQGPGSREEDTEGGFEYGGWVAPYTDEVFNKVLEEELKPADLLLGSKTFAIWENYWPQHAGQWPGIMEVTKYVLSTTRDKSAWANSVFLRDVEGIKRLKNTEGSDLKVWGSSKLVHLLLKHDLVDEMWRKIYPIVLGRGKRLFDEGSMPGAFTLEKSLVAPNGVIATRYKKAGEVKVGKVGEQ